MKTARLFCGLVLLLMIALPAGLPGVALAQDEALPPPPAEEPPPPPPDDITLATDFPKLEAIATGTFTFAVSLRYNGSKDRVFDLNVTAPTGWDVFVTPQYDSQRISSISLIKSFTGTTQTVKLTVNPIGYPIPEPGDYNITFKASSGEVVGKIELVAKITAKYVLNAAPANQLYNTTARSGQDNTFSLVVTNLGTASIDNISFSSDKPEGWAITPKPDKIDLLESLGQKTVDVNIKPPPKAVAGDYMITLRISGKQATADKMDIRVTVETPTVWGWIGVVIIAVVVVGLIVIFMRFGRR